MNMDNTKRTSTHLESDESRILIIDDNPAIHEDYKKILTRPGAGSAAFDALEADLFGEGSVVPASVVADGFHLDSAYQGEEGLALVTEAVQCNRPYVAAFVDMRMPPGWDGVETIERIWPVDPDLYVVICSAYSDYPWDEISERFNDKRKQLLFLSKPFQAIEVRQIALALTSQWQLAREVQNRRKMLESEIESRTRALETAESKYRTIFEKMHDAVILFDEDTCSVVDANHQAMALVGLAPDEIFSCSCHSLFPEGVLAKLEAAMKSETAMSDMLIEQVKFPNRERPIDVEISITQMALGGESKVLLIVRDVSKRRLLEAQLLQAQKLESVGQLAAGVAHEINTPTQYVGDNTQFLLDAFKDLTQVLAKYEMLTAAVASKTDADGLVKDLKALVDELDLEYLMEEIPTAIGQSLEGIQRVTEIVKALKSFSHPGSGAKEASDINAALKNTITVARNEWKYVADVETHLDENLPLVECHLGELNQVFLNIIVNAAQAIEGDVKRTDDTQKGKITIYTETRGEDAVEIRFEDNGPGIPEDIIKKVFDPFFTTKEVGKGTGQGLSIAHSVIKEMHRGTLTVTSEEGDGTCFTIRLPVIAKGETEEAPAASD
jgi:PAS domain S-box-containing protein